MALPAPAQDTLFHGVWGTGPDNVYAVGAGGTVLHYALSTN